MKWLPCLERLIFRLHGLISQTVDEINQYDTSYRWEDSEQAETKFNIPPKSAYTEGYDQQEKINELLPESESESLIDFYNGWYGS